MATQITTAQIKDGAVTGAKIASSVSLAGAPTAPTAAAGTNTSQLSTTEYVQRASVGSILYMYNNFI